jgi:hypothetical protein
LQDAVALKRTATAQIVELMFLMYTIEKKRKGFTAFASTEVCDMVFTETHQHWILAPKTSS